MADLPATARAVTDEAERRRIFTELVADLNQSHNPDRIRQSTQVEDWMAGSSLVEIILDQP